MPARMPEDIAYQVMLKAGLKPISIYKSAGTPWECECLNCHETVKPTVLSIKRGQGGCGYCVGTRRNPKKAADIMRLAGYEPLVEYPGSKIPWKCRHLACGEIVSPMFNKVQQGGGGCNTCSGKKRIDPVLARKKMIAAGMKPMVPFPGKDKKWKCICKSCGQIRYTYYSSIRDGRTGCKPCALQKNAILKRIPISQVNQILSDAKLKAIDPYENTDIPLKCECLVCGNTISPTLTAIRNGGGCAFCSQKRINPKDAIDSAVRAGLKPLEKFKGAQHTWKCKHLACGKIVYPFWTTIQKGGTSCAICNSAISADKFRMPASKAVGIMLKNGLEPIDKYVNALTNWKCKCLSCGRIVEPKLNSVSNGHNGCVYCSGRKVDEKEAIKFMKSAGLIPLEKFSASGSPWRCRHKKCGKEVTPSYSSIRSGQKGCIYCAEYGLQFEKPAFIYLITHTEFSSHKLGISGHTSKTDRLKAHKKQGWLVYKTMDTKTGETAFSIEQNVLASLRIDYLLSSFLSSSQMPQGGWTETVDASEIDLPTIWAKVEELSRVKR